MNKAMYFLTVILILPLSSLCYGIWNGYPAQGKEFSNVFKVFYTYWENGRKIETSFCTGTVVGDYTILTAGHCSVRNRGKPYLKVTVSNTTFNVDSIFIPNEYHNKYSNWRYRLIKFLNYKRYANPNNAAQQRQLDIYEDESEYAFKLVTGQDISLIRTKEKIPSYLRRTKLNFNFQNPGDSTYAVGYGHIYYSNYYRRYIYPTVPNYRSEKMIRGTNACHELWSKSRYDRVTSAGDSGSPLMLQNPYEQIGVLGGQLEYDYVYSSVYAKLENHMSFILYYLK